MAHPCEKCEKTIDNDAEGPICDACENLDLKIPERPEPSEITELAEFFTDKMGNPQRLACTVWLQERAWRGDETRRSLKAEWKEEEATAPAGE